MVTYELTFGRDPLWLLPRWVVGLPLWAMVPAAVVLGMLSLIGGLAAYLLLSTVWRVISVRVLHTEQYDAIPRPPHTSKRWWAIVGDLPAIRKAPPSGQHIAWARELKSDVFLYRILFYKPRIILADPKALHHILQQTNSYDFPKPDSTRAFLDNLLGNGLLVAEGDVHRRQRKIIQPAFNVSAVRDLTPLFFRHANAFVARLGAIVDATEGPADAPFIDGQSVECARESQPSKPALDISHWFGRMTIDIIGDAGFGHPFRAVEKRFDEQNDSIVESFRQLMKLATSISAFDILIIASSRVYGFGWLTQLPTKRRRTIRASRAALDRTGLAIIKEKRAAIRAELAQSVREEKDAKQFFEEGGKSKDLLYLMMKANIAPGVRDSERMSDAELLGQITTLLTAGHETTSTLLTWFLHIITSVPKRKTILAKLRAEIDEYFAGRDAIDYDALMSMPYLNGCTKEILRLVSPVSNTERWATRDDVIPLSRPYKSRDGKSTFDSVPVSKNQLIFVPIQQTNRSKTMWGETADEFDPDRWANVPAAAKESGYPSHILSFIEGPRGCIGSSFALAEFKSILCTVLRAFEFEAVEGWEIEYKQGVVVRPRVVGQEEFGTQLPVRMSRLAQT